MDGVILIDKPKGMTSFSVASRVRKYTGSKKSGHAGTLDPLATGVMAILLGNATKLSEYLSSEDKRYVAKFKFGVITDSLDSDGNVLEERECNFTKEQLLSAIDTFKGKIIQTPPKYSAIKVNGRKLYSYARSGEEVEIPSREVEIFSYELLEFDADNYEAVVDVHCSKGTYIRSLAGDLGEYLGCGAIMTELRRTQSGNFFIDDCITLDYLDENRHEAENRIIPCDKVIDFMREVTVKPEGLKALKNGNAIAFDLLDGYIPVEDELVRVYCEGEFYAIGKKDEDYLKVVKMIKVGG